MNSIGLAPNASLMFLERPQSALADNASVCVPIIVLTEYPRSSAVSYHRSVLTNPFAGYLVRLMGFMNTVLEHEAGGLIGLNHLS